jgi:opacity protein-like surface antigen
MARYTHGMFRNCAIAMLLLITVTATASAQAERGAAVAGAISATNMESDTSVSFSGAFEYRVSRVVGFEIETTFVPTLKSSFTDDRVTIQTAQGNVSSRVAAELGFTLFPTPNFTNPGGRAVFFTNNVRLSIPTSSTRLQPYFVAGGGIASIRRTADYVYTFPVFTTNPVPPGIVLPTLPVRTIIEPVRSSSIDLALTLGGGLDVRVASQLSIEADLRLFRLMGATDRNVGRFGVGVRYRF